MDIQNAYVILLLAALLFVGGLIGLFILKRSSSREVCAKNSQGAFIAGDGNENISVQIHHTPDNTPTPAWRKVAALLAWLATLAGTVIAALTYWLPRGGS